jgi:hypothetical protein
MQVFTFLTILILGTACNGQVKKDLPKEKEHPKLIKTLGGPRYGNAILGQKQYTSAAVRYWASVRAEVFSKEYCAQCSFLFLSSSLVFSTGCCAQLGSGSGWKFFKLHLIARRYRCKQLKNDTTHLHIHFNN